MKKESGKEEIKGFVWYSLRIAFWLMIGVSFGFLINNPSFSWLVGFIYFVLIIFVFIISIIHLKKHKAKALAIVSLVIASLFLLGLLLVIMATPATCPEGFVLGEDSECHEECGEGYYCLENATCCNDKCLVCEEGSFLASDCNCYFPPEE